MSDKQKHAAFIHARNHPSATPEQSSLPTGEAMSDRIARRMGAEFVQREQPTAEPSGDVEQRAREGIEQVARDIERAVAQGMAWISFSEAHAFADRLRDITKAQQSTAPSMPTFEEAWAEKEAEGYRYGRDALENVRFGYEIALAKMGAK